MVLIPRQAQTSLKDFLDYLATNSLTIFYQDELQYGQLKNQFINQLSVSHFQDILDVISGKTQDSQSDWEIRNGNTLLLANNHNHLDLAVDSSRLQESVKKGEFSLGQALTGYWLIEDQLTDLSQSPEQISYFSAMKASIDLLSTLDNNSDLTFTNQQPSSTFLTAQQKQNSQKETISLTKDNDEVNQDLFSPQLSNNTKTSLDPISNPEDNSSIDWLHTEISQPSFSEYTFQLNEFNYLEYQAFLHRLFSQLAQQKKLRYYDGKAFLAINDETLVAQFNEQNQWEYVSGTLSQHSLNQLQDELNSSSSIRNSSSSQSSPLTL